jgi:hypothetical protein
VHPVNAGNRYGLINRDPATDVVSDDDVLALLKNDRRKQQAFVLTLVAAIIRQWSISGLCFETRTFTVSRSLLYTHSETALQASGMTGRTGSRGCTQ